jgi:putative ABC transport system ATP-binding protein
MNDRNAIIVRDVIVEYNTLNGKIRALDCPYLEVKAGGSIAVMGQSGCGKSTLLGLMAGLAQPVGGSISIGGTQISALSEKQRIEFRRRNFGMVYQADNLLPFLSIEENVALQLGISQPKNASLNMVYLLTLLQRLGLSGLGKRLPDQLSGGQRQRAAVARAVIHRPKVVLADEPTGALDPLNAKNVIELLIQIHREIGATLVVVTHDPAIAARLDTTVYLEKPVSTGYAEVLYA